VTAATLDTLDSGDSGHMDSRLR